LVSFVGNSFADNLEWIFVGNDRKNDITLHYRMTDKLVEFKGVTHIKSKLSAFVALFQDVAAMPNWAGHIHEMVLLKKVSDTEYYTYMITNMQWPLSKRYSVLHTSISQDDLSGNVVINGREANSDYFIILSKEKQDFINRQKNYIHIINIKSYWTFKPQSGGMVEVEYQGHGDPAGNIPKAISQGLLRNYIRDITFDMLKNMRDFIHDQKYQSRRFSFIKEPEVKS
jgi:hypothetical protein